MLKVRRTTITRALIVGITVATVSIVGWKAQAQQGKGQAVNDLPNPYRTIENYFKLPEGRTWGSTSAVEIDIDGRSIWVAERCGLNLCLDRATGLMSNLPSVLKFDATGKLVKSFGQGLLIFPHGIHVDRQGNVWVTDGQDDAPSAARGGGAGAAAGAAGAGRGAGAAAPAAGAPPAGGAGAPAGGAGRGAGAGGGRGAGAPDAAAGAARGAGAGGGRGADAAAAPQAARGAAPATIPGPASGSRYGHQVFKFSPDGKVLLRLGASGGGAAPGYFYQPNDVITNAAGEIFVSEGHGNGTGRILKFTKEGNFIKVFGERGSGPGQLNIPHSLAFDSRGRLFVADRGAVRIAIFDQEGKFLEEWFQFSRLSGIYIDRNDMIYGADSESSPTSNPGGWRRGIRIGSARDGKVTAFIPDPQHPDGSKPSEQPGTSAAEGVAVDAVGNIYGAEVGPRKVQKYVRK